MDVTQLLVAQTVWAAAAVALGIYALRRTARDIRADREQWEREAEDRHRQRMDEWQRMVEGTEAREAARQAAFDAAEQPTPAAR